MPGDMLVTLIALLLGLGAAFYFAIWALMRILRALARGVGWLFAIDSDGSGRSSDGRVVQSPLGRRCANRSCGHVEPRPARFCPRCGHPFLE